MTSSSDQFLLMFRQWLETPETYAYLVRFVEKKSRQDDNTASLRANEPEDLCQEYLVYVLDRFLVGTRLSADLLLLIRTAQYRRVLELAWRRFTWHYLEIARNKQHNPRGYLYRRLREILQHNKQRFKVIQNRQKYFCYSPASLSAELLCPFPPPAGENPRGYAHWPTPPPVAGQTPEQYLFSSTWLLDVADFFWQQAQQQHRETVEVPIRELCRYLADHYPWLNNPLREEGKDRDLIEQLADGRETPEEQLCRTNALQSVGPLAAQLVATWPLEQHRVFALRLSDPPTNLEEIAAHLGLADHNRVYAQYQKAVQSLKRFTGNWPGLPLSELPEEVAETFIEEIKRLCKNSLQCP